MNDKVTYLIAFIKENDFSDYDYNLTEKIDLKELINDMEDVFEIEYNLSENDYDYILKMINQ